MSFLPSLATPRGGSSARRRRPLVEEETEEEKELVKSLQIKNDDRYVAIDYYREHGGTHATNGHFARLVRTNRRMVGLKEQETSLTQDSNFADVSNWNLEALEEAGERAPRIAVSSIDNRIEWQASFDQKVRSLMVDFQLSDVPSCRLNHLDRMHSWFEEHGAKQTRKAREGPSYLTADRNGAMPPGSTKDLPGQLSTTSQILRNEFRRT